MKDGELTVAHTRQIVFKKVNADMLAYLEKECIAFLIFVDQGTTVVGDQRVVVLITGFCFQMVVVMLVVAIMTGDFCCDGDENAVVVAAADDDDDDEKGASQRRTKMHRSLIPLD